MFDLTEANEYFDTHLKFKLWNSLDEQTRQGALNCAIQDITAYLNVATLDETDIFSYCAVFEQAVYLAEYFDTLNAPQALIAESIEGVGSRSFGSRNSSQAISISPRAAGFLERIAPPGAVGRG